MKRLATVALGLLLVSPAVAAEKPKVKASDMQKAFGLSQLLAESEKAVDAVDGATRLGIIIQNDSGGPQARKNATVVVTPEDPEWAAVRDAAKALAARRITKAKADMEGLPISVEAEPEAAPTANAPTPAAPAPAAPAAPAPAASP